MTRAIEILFAAALSAAAVSAATLPSLHVSSNGVIVDNQDKPVFLRGINRSATGSGNADAGATDADYANANKLLSMNLVRLFVNTDWWMNNVTVPIAGMKYQDYIDALIQRAEKYGNYVMIVKAGQFPDPPCAADGKNCPAANQGDLNCQAKAAVCAAQDTSGQYVDPAFAFWAAFAKRYAADPAILYYTWEEPHNIDAATWSTDQNQLIAAIRTYSPQSLIFIGNAGGDFEAIAQGQLEDLAFPNLVWDAHIFGASSTAGCTLAASPYYANWPQVFSAVVSFAEQHGHAVSITEWGGCNDTDSYHTNITTFAQAHSIALAYYDAANLFTSSGLSANGIKVQQAYANMGPGKVSTVSSANGSPILAAEMIALAMGTNLAPDSLQPMDLPLPFSVLGTSLSVRDAAGVDRLSPLSYVSPTQVNYEVPPGTGLGTATITIAGAGGTFATGTVQIAAVSPGMFTADGSGKGVASGYLTISHPDGTSNSTLLYDCQSGSCVSVPADLGAAGDQPVLTLYGTGFRGRSALDNVTLRLAGQTLTPVYAGPQGGIVGLDQVDLTVPQSLRGSGEIDAVLTVDGVVANTVRVNLR